MTSVRRSLALSFIEVYFGVLLALGSSMVLARLLTPEQIGLYSVTLAVIGIAQVLRELGVGNFLIQTQELHDDHVRSAFSIAMVMGVTLNATLYFSAPWIAQFYSTEAMTGLMRIVSLNFLVMPFCSISLALLRRDMRFKALLYVGLAATSAGTAVTLTLAWNGFGATSMAVGSVVANVVTCLGAWWARGGPTPLWPGWRKWRAVLNFGGQSVATGIVTSVAMDINDLVVGRVLGFGPVAILSRAQGLMNVFHRDVMSAVRNVAYPAYARIHRDGGSVESAHAANVVMVTACAWPFYGFVALFPLEALRILFGPQWDAAAVLVPVFCMAGAVVTVSSLALSALMAVGRIDLVTKAELLFQPLRAGMAVVAAVYFESVLACALAYLIAFALHPFVLYVIKERSIPTLYRPLLRGLAHSLGITVMTLLPALVWKFALAETRGDIATWWEMAVVAGVTALTWIVALRVARHPLAMDPAIRRLFVNVPLLGRY
jgi:O-antigen/teichoic acid export membrane protein